jgi:hypothetical protein
LAFLRLRLRDIKSANMPRRFSGSSVSVTLSSSRSLMPGWMAQHVAAAAGITGVDVDATSALAIWLASRVSGADSYVPIRSIWIPAHFLRSNQGQRVIDRLTRRQPDVAPQIVAVLPAGSSLRSLSRDLDLMSTATTARPVAIGLPPSALRGGRPHLVYLGGIRRLAEEWDLSIAIDLSRAFDPTWEAEAAIARLGDRLSIIRLRASAPSRTAVGQDRVSCRALHAAIDRSRLLDVAISPIRVLPLPASPRSAILAAELAADYVHERAAIHAEALKEGIDHFEGSRPSRSN